MDFGRTGREKLGNQYSISLSRNTEIKGSKKIGKIWRGKRRLLLFLNGIRK